MRTNNEFLQLSSSLDIEFGMHNWTCFRDIFYWLRSCYQARLIHMERAVIEIEEVSGLYRRTAVLCQCNPSCFSVLTRSCSRSEIHTAVRLRRGLFLNRRICNIAQFTCSITTFDNETVRNSSANIEYADLPNYTYIISEVVVLRETGMRRKLDFVTHSIACICCGP